MLVLGMVVLIGRYGSAIWGTVVLFGGCGIVILRYGCVITMAVD